MSAGIPNNDKKSFPISDPRISLPDSQILGKRKERPFAAAESSSHPSAERSLSDPRISLLNSQILGKRKERPLAAERSGSDLLARRSFARRRELGSGTHLPAGKLIGLLKSSNESEEEPISQSKDSSLRKRRAVMPPALSFDAEPDDDLDYSEKSQESSPEVQTANTVRGNLNPSEEMEQSIPRPLFYSDEISSFNRGSNSDEELPPNVRD